MTPPVFNFPFPLNCENCGVFPFEEAAITQDPEGTNWITSHEKCGGALIMTIQHPLHHTFIDDLKGE